MKRSVLAAIGGASIAVTALTGLADAHAATPSPTIPNAIPHVVGGERAPQTDWAVSVQSAKTDKPGYQFSCTGEQLNAEWVMTTRHCIEGISWQNVYFTNDLTQLGEADAVDRVVGTPDGDVALIHLSTPHAASQYAPPGRWLHHHHR